MLIKNRKLEDLKELNTVLKTGNTKLIIKTFKKFMNNIHDDDINL